MARCAGEHSLPLTGRVKVVPPESLTIDKVEELFLHL